MATLLYEIGTEEMPAQYMPGILKNYKELAETKLKEARIPFDNAAAFLHGIPEAVPSYPGSTGLKYEWVEDPDLENTYNPLHLP